MMSSIARFFLTHGNHWQWPSLTEIMNIEKTQLFIEFSPIFLNNLTFVEYRKSNFLI
jgi:hypothetical protein